MVIVVRTQAEFDALPDSFIDTTQIEIRSDNEDEIIVIRRIPINSDIFVMEESEVYLYGTSRVNACDLSLVYAFDASTVYANDESTVQAYGSSIIYLYDLTYVSINSSFVKVTYRNKLVNYVKKEHKDYYPEWF